MKAAAEANKAMLKHNTTLKELNLSDNYGQATEGKDGAIALAVGIAEGLQDNGALAKLDLSNNNWEDNKSPDFIRPIATMLKTNTSLKELSLAGNNLNAEA